MSVINHIETSIPSKCLIWPKITIFNHPLELNTRIDWCITNIYLLLSGLYPGEVAVWSVCINKYIKLTNYSEEIYVQSRKIFNRNTRIRRRNVIYLNWVRIRVTRGVACAYTYHAAILSRDPCTYACKSQKWQVIIPYIKKVGLDATMFIPVSNMLVLVD